MSSSTIIDWLFLGTIFGHGYLISRIVVKTKIAEILVQYLSIMARGNFLTLLFYLVISSTVLSAFIPNMVTLLTFMPVVAQLSKNFESKNEQISIAMLLAVIYGANIGGVGSLIGSPANAILLLHMQAQDLRIREEINFFTWFEFSVPTVIPFMLIAWLVLALFSFNIRSAKFQVVAHPDKLTGRRLFATVLSVCILLFWIIISYYRGEVLPALQEAGKLDYGGYTEIAVYTVAIIVGLGFPIFVFLFPIGNKSDQKKPLLVITDLWGGISQKGFVFLALMISFAGVLYLLNVPQYLERLSEVFRPNNPETMQPGSLGYFLFCFSLALLVTFSTEIMSNTTVSLTFFALAQGLAVGIGIPPEPPLAIVAISSTCAFMSPIATPVNAIAFGSMPTQKFRRTLLSGAILNTCGAAWISWAVPQFFQF